MKLLMHSFQTGGPIDTTGYAAKSAALMKANQHLNWVQRAENNNNGLSPIDNKTHFMTYWTNDKGEHIVSPTVVQLDNENKLTELDNKGAIDYSRKYGINVGKDRNFAEYFSQVGYKAKFPKRDYEEAKYYYSKFLGNNLLLNKK